jgi:hypothetical protein
MIGWGRTGLARRPGIWRLSREALEVRNRSHPEADDRDGVTTHFGPPGDVPPERAGMIPGRRLVANTPNSPSRLGSPACRAFLGELFMKFIGINETY